MDVVGSPLCDRLLCDLRVANIWKFAMRFLLKPSSLIHLGPIIRHASHSCFWYHLVVKQPWPKTLVCETFYIFVCYNIYHEPMPCFCHFMNFSSTFGNTSNVAQDGCGRWVCQGGRCAQVWHAWFLGFHTLGYFPPKSLKRIWCTHSSNLNLNFGMSKKHKICKHPRKLMTPRVRYGHPSRSHIF
jgi:hypothetical protein